MRRLIVIAFVGLLAIGLTAFLAPRITDRLLTSTQSEAASPLESVELLPPVASPGIITPAVQTFVTLISTLPDSAIKRPKLQFYDPSVSKWKTLTLLKDDGKGPDRVPNDREFTARVAFLESAGSVSLFKVKTTARLTGEVPAPVQLRVSGRKKGQLGLVVSPVVSIPSVHPTTLTVGNATGGPAAVLLIPQTFDTRVTNNRNNVLLIKGGPNGYNLAITTFINPDGLTLKDWVNTQLFGYDKVDEGLDIKPVTISGLQGYVYESSDESSDAVTVWLADPVNSRIFQLEASPQGGDQTGAFGDNTDEIMAIVNSFQLQP